MGLPKGIKKSEDHKRKIGEANRGNKRPDLAEYNRLHPKIKEKNPTWKGGVTPVHELIRKSKEYKLWRKAVFERDNYTCIWCKVRSAPGVKVVLHADHIKAFAFYPELRFAIDNGRTLCADCHRKTDTWGNKFYR